MGKRRVASQKPILKAPLEIGIVADSRVLKDESEEQREERRWRGRTEECSESIDELMKELVSDV